MTWKRSDNLLSRQLKRHHLDGAIAAARICQKAEALHPGLFRAISLANGIFHLEVKKENQLAFKLIEGKLLKDIQSFATDQNLPMPRRIRLTFPGK